MIIIDDNFRMRVDDRNYILEERYLAKDKDGNEKGYQWKVEGYFVNPLHALDRMLLIYTNLATASGGKDMNMEDYISYIENVKNRLEPVFKGVE